MSNNINDAYKELYEILKRLDKEEYDMIPTEIINVVTNKMNKEYVSKVDFDSDFDKNDLLPKTRTLIYIIYRDYCAPADIKNKIFKYEQFQLNEIEKLKSEKYDIDVFGKKRNNNKKDKKDNKNN